MLVRAERTIDATENDHTPLDDIGVPMLPSPTELNIEQRAAAGHRRGEEERLLDREQSLVNKRSLRTQQIIAVCVFVTVIIYGVQAGLMRETLKEAIRAAKSADESSTRALAMMQSDLRAWVVVGGMDAPPYESGGWKPIEAPIRYVYITDKFRGPYFLDVRNTGKTPATELRYAVKRELVPRDSLLSWDFYEKKNRETNDVSISAPSSEGKIRIDELPVLSSRQLETIKADKLLVRVLPQIEYSDIFGKHHRTRSCVYLMPDLSSFVNCPTGNEVN